MNEDEQLVNRVLTGNPEAFGELVKKYQDRLYNTFVHITGSTHEAEEVAQDAMLQAYAKLETFRGNSSFYTWLYRIAFNLSVSRQRKRRPRTSLEEIQESIGLDPTLDTETPDAVAERGERAAQVHAALGKLSEEYRTILVLREMEDCDYDSIAEMLAIPIGTVRSRLHRARTALRQELEPFITDHHG